MTGYLRRTVPLLAASISLVLVLCVGTADAHGDEGEVSVTHLEQSGPSAVEIEVGIVYAGDEHLAQEARVSAAFTGPGGESVGPVDLVRTGDTTSLYAATVEVPVIGDWTVQVTSIEPDGAASGTVTLVDQPDPTTPEQLPAPVAATPDTEIAADGTEADRTVALDAAPAAQDDSGSNTALIVAAVAVAVLVAGGGLLIARNRRPADPAA